MAKTYFLRTHFKTYLFRLSDDRLIHHLSRGRAINLDVEINLEQHDYSTLVGFFRLHENARPVPVVTELLPGGKVALRTTEGFLSASPHGEFALRDRIDLCEIFTPATAEDVCKEPRRAVVEVKRRTCAFRIPKILHQIYFGDFPLPDAVQTNIEDLKRMHPDWEFMLWREKDAEDFILKYFGHEVLARYLRINPNYGAARADLFRYLCVYQLGGVYLDIKSGCRVALDALVRSDDAFLLSHWDQDTEHKGFGLHLELADVPGGEYQQWHVIAAPGHPYLEQVINDVLAHIDEYHEAMDGVGKHATLRVTGPISYTLSISKILNEHSHRFIESASAGLIYKKIRDIAVHLPPSYSLQTTPLILGAP